jgi:hypothetical protein
VPISGAAKRVPGKRRCVVLLERALNLGTVLLVVAWSVSMGAVAGGWVWSESGLGDVGIVCSIAAVGMTVVKESRKTRRVIRAVAGLREPVHTIH